jgi:CD63 antigen
MVQGGLTVVIKYLLFLFNFLFWLSGIGLIVAGAVIQIRYSNYINFLNSSFLNAPLLLIAVGSIISIIGFFGCCGAIRENYCMTMTFAVLLGTILILELAAGIASYVMRQHLHEFLHENTVKGMTLYNQTDAQGVTAAWDRLQEQFKCCGVSNFTNWANATVYQGSYDVPPSCCKRERDSGDKCYKGVRSPEFDDVSRQLLIHTQGCLEGLTQFIGSNIAIVGGLAVGVAFFQMMGVAIACVYARFTKKGYESVE